VLGEFRFLVNNEYTGEKTEVTIDADKIPLYRDKSIFSRYPEACPFFRYEQVSEKGYCTVHQTRPGICRDYGCWRILILGSGGERVGRIMASRHLASDDETVTRLFEEHIDHLIESDDAVWDDTVIRMLKRAGYTVRT
jgi:Fe-S-cluster containining protein